MASHSMQVQLSAIDEERFGVRTARASYVTEAELPALLNYCHANQVQFLIARCRDTEIRAVQAMEHLGFLLMDTLVYYARDLKKTPIPPDTGKALIRPILPGEEDTVKQVATESFKGYFGHYHADPRLDRTRCDEAYTSWAVRSCVSREVANEVLVAVVGNQIVGFATLRLNNTEEGEGVLFGVGPEAQGQGIYRSFMVNAMRWCLGQGVGRMVVSTQIVNIAVQKVWTRVGFEPSHAYYTFHKWFDG